MILTALLLALACAPPQPARPASPAAAHAPRAQEAGQDPPAPRDETPAERARRLRQERAAADEQAGAVLGPDGQPLVPGALPKGASEPARAAWRALREAVFAPVPVRAFDLSFYLLQRRDGPGGNSLQARIQFLWPGFVRAILTSGRQHLRGPQGDWLIDGDEKVRLVGREGAEDRAQIDEVIGIARNFIALTDPASLRLASLELVDRPPGGLPPHLVEAAAGLDWLAVTSPDFRLYSTPKRDGNAPPLFRALLGVDRVKHEVGLALIHEAGTAPTMLETTLLVHLQDQHAVGGYVVPRAIHVYRIDPQSRPWRFEEKPRSELTLRDTGLDLAPHLAPADFEP